jgi:lipopolysaccharide biosynthesis glycosyltransferase
VAAAVPIVCAVDERYLGPFCVLLQSLATAYGAAGDLRIVVLHRRLGDAGRQRIHGHAARLGLQVELRDVPGPPAAYPVLRWTTEAMYLRLAIPEVMAGSDVVLYLDADTVALRDLRPLLGTALAGAPLAAARDEQNPVLRVARALPGWRELGLPPSREYFNSGVMLLDLRECGRRGLFEECHRFLRDRARHTKYGDQCALNWAAGDDWLRLDRRWNTVPFSAISRLPHWRHHAEEVSPLEGLIAGEDAAAILHFAGPDKPWNGAYPASRVRDVYLSFARQVMEAEDE